MYLEEMTLSSDSSPVGDVLQTSDVDGGMHPCEEYIDDGESWVGNATYVGTAYINRVLWVGTHGGGHICRYCLYTLCIVWVQKVVHVQL